ncbi:hypothetical protein BS50DRAFT_657969 [Corynespora cassiicola Philippines]|uniref:Uncharacterized protein n=1 Tax=Corynespora cassiicola Philippines TaxID=1448308 RepID=A0A2T2P392_CORCC|nr:hypothetical protein BS50DRAFT_657969 [Corynespora cassiicola Philippines]
MLRPSAFWPMLPLPLLPPPAPLAAAHIAANSYQYLCPRRSRSLLPFAATVTLRPGPPRLRAPPWPHAPALSGFAHSSAAHGWTDGCRSMNGLAATWPAIRLIQSCPSAPIPGNTASGGAWNPQPVEELDSPVGISFVTPPTMSCALPSFAENQLFFFFFVFFLSCHPPGPCTTQAHMAAQVRAFGLPAVSVDVERDRC